MIRRVCFEAIWRNRYYTVIKIQKRDEIMPFPLKQEEIQSKLYANRRDENPSASASASASSEQGSVSNAEIINVFYEGARQINPDLTEISSKEMKSLWKEYLTLLPEELQSQAERLSFLVVNTPQEVSSDQVGFLSAFQASLIANAAYWTAIQHRGSGSTTSDYCSRRLEWTRVSSSNGSTNFSAVADKNESSDTSEFYNAWVPREQSKNQRSEFAKFVELVPVDWTNPNNLMKLGVAYVQQFQSDFKRLWQNPQIQLMVTAGGVPLAKMFSLLNEAYVHSFARYITALYEGRESETDVFHGYVVGVLLNCDEGFTAPIDAGMPEVLEHYVRHVVNNLSFGIADVFTQEDKRIQKAIFSIHVAIQTLPKGQADLLRPIVGLTQSQSLVRFFPSNVSLSSGQFQTFPEENEVGELSDAASALLSAAQIGKAPIEGQENSEFLGSISEDSFKYRVGISPAAIVKHFIHSNQKYFSRIDDKICPLIIRECAERRLLKACISDARCPADVRGALLLGIEDYIFSERLKKAVTTSSDSSSSPEEIKFAKALESVAILMMYPELLDENPEQKQSFESLIQQELNTMRRVQLATEWMYQHPELIEKIPAQYNAQSKSLRKKEGQDDLRKSMLNTFVPVCLSPVTLIGQVDRMFNRGNMQLDRLAVPNTLLEHFSNMQTRILACDQNNEQSLEALLIKFAKETFDLLLEDIESVFPDPNVFMPFIKQISDFPQGSSDIKKRNILICHIMALQLSQLVSQFGKEKTLNAQFCSMVAGRVSDFLAVDRSTSLDRPDFYTAFKEEIQGVFSKTETQGVSSAPPQKIYDTFRLQFDAENEEDEKKRHTFSSAALLAASTEQLDRENPQKTLQDILALKGKIDENLLIKTIANLCVTAADPVETRNGENSTPSVFKEELVSLMPDDILPEIFHNALLQAKGNSKYKAMSNILNIVFSAVETKNDPKLLENIVKVVVDFPTDNALRNMIDALDNALSSHVALKTLAGGYAFAPKFKQAAADNDNDELTRLSKLLPHAGTYKTQLLNVLDCYQENPETEFPSYIQGYLEEKLNSLGEFRGKESIRTVLSSHLPLFVKLEILGQIGRAKADYNPVWRGRRGAVQNFYQGISRFVGVKETDIESKFKDFRETIAASDIAEKDSAKIERDLQRRVLRESNHDSKVTFVKQFNRWVNFSNVSKSLVEPDDLLSINARPTMGEITACIDSANGVAQTPEVSGNSLQATPEVSSGGNLVESAKPKKLSTPTERSESLISALKAAVVEKGCKNKVSSENTEDEDSAVDLWIHEHQLTQLKRALEQFSRFHLSDLSLFGKHHVPAGMQTIIDMINTKPGETPKSLSEILSALKKLVGVKVKDYNSYGASLGLSRRSVETQEAYKKMNEVLENFEPDENGFQESDGLINPVSDKKSDTELMQELIDGLNTVHKNSLSSSQRISLDIQTKM